MVFHRGKTLMFRGNQKKQATFSARPRFALQVSPQKLQTIHPIVIAHQSGNAKVGASESPRRWALISGDRKAEV